MASEKKTYRIIFELFEIDIYPHPFAKTGWFINLHRNKAMLCENSRYESKRKAKLALIKILINLKNEIESRIKTLSEATQ